MYPPIAKVSSMASSLLHLEKATVFVPVPGTRDGLSESIQPIMFLSTACQTSCLRFWTFYTYLVNCFESSSWPQEMICDLVNQSKVKLPSLHLEIYEIYSNIPITHSRLFMSEALQIYIAQVSNFFILTFFKRNTGVLESHFYWFLLIQSEFVEFWTAIAKETLIFRFSIVSLQTNVGESLWTPIIPIISSVQVWKLACQGLLRIDEKDVPAGRVVVNRSIDRPVPLFRVDY